MAELKNSQRISYKATYNQASPSTLLPSEQPPPAGRDAAPPRQRAVEKAAFVQSLRIIPEELNAISGIVGGRGAAHESKNGLTAAVTAIATLIADRSSTSTLNNAFLFANVAVADLVTLANALAVHRQATADAIKVSLAAITSAYRDSHSAPLPVQATPKVAHTPTVDPPSTGSTNSLGLPILTTVRAPQKRPTEGDQPKLQSRGTQVHVTVDETKASTSTFSSSLPTTALVGYPLSQSAAILWAEKHEPALFAKLNAQVAPYTGLSADERNLMGASRTTTETLRATLDSTLDARRTQAAAAGFQSRMTIEPVGNLHLERIEMYPAGIERGELIHSIPLAPGETVNVSHKEWSVSEKQFEEIVQDYFEGFSEEGVAEKTDIAMSSDSQSQHATALNIGASLSASYSSVTLSTNFGYSATSNDTQSKKDSRNHSMAITKKASARTKKDHKITFKVSSVAGSEDQSVRVISNSSPTDAMRIDYFQLARKWKVDLLRYGLRMTYDIVIPNPGSGLVTLVEQVKALDALIGQPFQFTLPLSAITYNSLASDPLYVSNYDQLAAEYDAVVTAPPEPRKWVNVHKETAEVKDYDHLHFDSLEFEIDDSYYIYQVDLELQYQTNSNEKNDYLLMLAGESIDVGAKALIGQSGKLSLDVQYQYIYNYAINLTFVCRPKVQALLDWRLQAWNQMRQGAEDQYDKSMQSYKDQQAKLVSQIAEYDALTLRRMEQEEIMKGVLRWLLGPQFSLVSSDIAALFGPDSNDPGVNDVLDPNSLTDAEWQSVMERGEFIKYVHNAIEWENVLYFTYPYFWDDNKLWDFKKFLYHPDPTHRTFLRAGAARVVLTIRPGFEASFTSLVEAGAFNALSVSHPYVTIAQEIQDFANTNYPGFPPANPEQNARPLLYLEQRRVWREMQFVIQLLNAFKAATGSYPTGDPGNAVPATQLAPYLDGPVVIAGVSYNGVNDYNAQANAQLLALDASTPQEALLPTYTAVPLVDIAWGLPYFYKCPGDTGDYDLISFGADGKSGGVDKNADISANCEASLIATWYEYTPTGALDIGVTTNAPNSVPADPSSAIG